jgi:hypothetical protein
MAQTLLPDLAFDRTPAQASCSSNAPLAGDRALEPAPQQYYPCIGAGANDVIPVGAGLSP